MTPGNAVGGSAARERLADRAAEHELLGHHLHRLPQRDPHHRLAGARGEAGVPAARIAGVARSIRVSLPVSISPQVDALTSSESDSPRWRSQSPRDKLVADQCVSSRRIRDAQQRLRDAHQQHAFGRRQIVLLQERLDASAGARIGAQPLDPLPREIADRPRLPVVLRDLRRKRDQRRALVGEEGVADRRPFDAGGNQPALQDLSAHCLGLVCASGHGVNGGPSRVDDAGRAGPSAVRAQRGCRSSSS